MEIQDVINAVWQNGEIKVSKSEITFKPELLEREMIVFHDDGDAYIINRKNAIPAYMPYQRKYQMPDFTDKVKALISNGACNILLTGAMGTGKTEFVYEICKQCGFSQVFQINGSENLTAMDFYGTMSVAVDPATKQNYTTFEKGILYRAFIEGTQLDGQGNQVLDDKGEPIVVGKPALFFLDEFAAMLPEVFLGVFNRAMEIPRNGGVRSIEIPLENGKVIKSHPDMVMIFSGNTVGTGNGGDYQVSYTAQSSKMDESTLNRINACYKFGYNKSAEREMAISMLQDDLETDRLLKMRDDLRNAFKRGDVERLFSTRHLISICKQAVAYRKANITNYIMESIKDTVFNSLSDNDKHAWGEEIRIVWGKDINATNNNAEYDVF
jgi:MoxR-like ATPase